MRGPEKQLFTITTATGGWQINFIRNHANLRPNNRLDTLVTRRIAIDEPGFPAPYSTPKSSLEGDFR